MVDASGSTAYAYDVRNRLVNKLKTWAAVGLSVALNYAYDAVGNVTNIASSSPNGVALSYSYDALNRLETATDAHTGTTTYGYDGVGNLAGYTYPNGLTSTYEYDALYRLTNLSTLNAQAAPVAWYRYTVGPSGHRLTAAENVATTSGVQTINRLYSYDATYRLVNESYSISGPVSLPPAANVGYTLDDVGNRLTRNSTLPGVEGQNLDYDANDRLTTDTYDANGNTVTGHLVQSAPPVSDAYDFEDRLINRNNGQVILVYDGDGNRVAKTVGGVTTLYLVDDQNPTGYAQVLEELAILDPPSSTFVVTRAYTYGLDLISQDQLLDEGNGSFAWAASFYGYDGHGNVRYLTSESGEITDTYDYDAFGTLIAQSTSFDLPTPNSYLYSGEQFDTDLGLYYNRARYLNPDSGRFWTLDWFEGFAEEPSTLHRYMFVGADPANRIDPTGNSDVNLNSQMFAVRIQGQLNRMAGPGTVRIGQRLYKRIGCGLGVVAFRSAVSLEAHHIKPQVMGGGKLPTINISGGMHESFHWVLNIFLQVEGLKPLGAGKEYWIAAMSDLTKAAAAKSAVLSAAATIDRICGLSGPTSLYAYTMQHWK